MWINVGRSQFHLPTGKPQTLRGCTGIVVPDRDGADGAAGAREEAARRHRASRTARAIPSSRPRSPWGDRIRCHFPDPDALRAHPARHALCRVRRAARHGRGHRALLSRDHGRARPRSRMTAPAGSPGSRSAPTRTCSSARPTGRSRPMTAITSRSTSPTSPGPTRSSARSTSSAWKTARARVPLHRHRRSRHAQGAVPDRARGALEPSPALRPPARQPQPGPDQHGLHAGPRRPPSGSWPEPSAVREERGDVGSPAASSARAVRPAARSRASSCRRGSA